MYKPWKASRLSKTKIHDLFDRHRPVKEIDGALQMLEREGRSKYSSNMNAPVVHGHGYEP
jgi:hypothetical protein